MSLNRTLAGLIDASGELTSGGGLDVYATKEDLPSSGMSSGDQAYVTGNSRFYISNGSGWYNVALINATPSLTISPTGAIELSKEGASTVITLTATDSDNAVDGITFSVESDGSFAGLGTISQDSSVFTITPLSEDSATTTESTLTFKASDGISFGSGDTALSLIFKVANSNYTTLLLKNEETSDNQVDASTNNHTITEVGNVTSTALSPYHPGGYSAFWSGTETNSVSAYMYPTNSDNNILTFGTGDFTVEFWLYFKNSGSIASLLDGRPVGTTGAYFGMHKLANNTLTLDVNASVIITTSAQEPNTWYHIAVVRNSGTITYYIDGTSAGSAVDSSNLNSTPTNRPILGANGYSTGWYSLNGYMRDLRIVKGTAVYTSNFTRPTSDLPTISGTTLHTFNKPYIEDFSSNQYPIQNSGTCGTERVSPLDYIPYTKADHGGSVYFDGSGDYLQLPSNSGFSFGTGDFTVEFWVNYPAISNTNGKIVIDSRPTSTNGSYWTTGPINTGVMKFTTMSTGGNSVQDTVARPNQWVHYATTRSGTTLRLFANGKLVATTTDSSNISSSSPTVGKNAFSSFATDTWWSGYISDIRIVKGTAVYTSDFTPPTAPLTAITNTQLLTCTNKNDIWDVGTGNLLTKAGDVTGGANSGDLKFGQTAVYFDGSGDYLEIGNITDLQFGTGDFTVEGWVYKSGQGTNGYDAMVGIGQTSGATTGWYLEVSTDRGIFFVINNNNISYGTWTNDSAWHHIAVTRSSGTVNIWLDGSSVASGSLTTSVPTNGTTAKIGSYYNGTTNYTFNGYMQDVRITKGLARYTTSFTPPTTEFDG
jgi:hypothetical protein